MTLDQLKISVAPETTEAETTWREVLSMLAVQALARLAEC